MKKKINAGKIAAEVGAGAVAAAALAVAGGYVLWERMGKQKQARVKSWVAKARQEAARNVANARKMSQTEYKRIVDAAVKRYGSLSDVNKAELAKTAATMKGEWSRIQSQAKVMAKQMQKSGKRMTATPKKGSRTISKRRAKK
jgi:hypothetical protein